MIQLSYTTGVFVMAFLVGLFGDDGVTSVDLVLIALLWPLFMLSLVGKVLRKSWGFDV